MRHRAAAALAVGALALGGGAAAVATAGPDGGSPRPGAHMGGHIGGHMGGIGSHLGGHMGGQMGGHMVHAAVDSEYAFLAEMIAHHEEAIDAAGELARSDRAAMRAFGIRIIDSQSAEVAQMRSWLAEWHPDRSGEVDYDPMMRDLSRLSGDELDETFLSDMVTHHMGAVMMSQQLLVRDLAEHAPVARLAVRIRDNQRDEIWLMQRWLRAWFDGS